MDDIDFACGSKHVSFSFWPWRGLLVVCGKMVEKTVWPFGCAVFSFKVLRLPKRMSSLRWSPP